MLYYHQKAKGEIKMKIETSWIYLAARYDFSDRAVTKANILKSYLESDCAENAQKRTEEAMNIKIGETAYRCQRNRLLREQEDIEMKLMIKFKGTKSDRLFVEAYVRSRIENRYSTFNVRHNGNDHFYCFNSNIIRTIWKEFPTYVQEGFNILNTIKNKNTSSL